MIMTWETERKITQKKGNKKERKTRILSNLHWPVSTLTSQKSMLFYLKAADKFLEKASGKYENHSLLEYNLYFYLKSHIWVYVNLY